MKSVWIPIAFTCVCYFEIWMQTAFVVLHSTGFENTFSYKINPINQNKWEKFKMKLLSHQLTSSRIELWCWNLPRHSWDKKKSIIQHWLDLYPAQWCWLLGTMVLPCNGCLQVNNQRLGNVQRRHQELTDQILGKDRRKKQNLLWNMAYEWWTNLIDVHS